MDEDESLKQAPMSLEVPPDRISPYELLMRQSRKMGYLATRTYDVTKEFLKQDVSVVSPKSPDFLLFGRKVEMNKPIQSPGRSEKIRTIVQRSNEVLAAVRTVILPINLFPDSIVVDRTKVTITKRTFFWTAQVITTRIEDILQVTSNFGPIFGSITIATRVMNSTDHYEINYFFRKDAIYIKELIQGYVIAQHNRIDTSDMSKKQLIKTMLDLGRDSTL